MRHHNLSRRGVLHLLLGATGAAGMSILTNPGRTRPIRMNQKASNPPLARIDGVKETIWGRTIDDPYRWMENPNDADWQPYMERQAAHARAVLDAIPDRDKLAARVKSLSAEVPRPRKIIPRGGKIFYENRPKSTNNFKLFVRDGIKQPERLLIDPSTLAQGDSHVSID